MECSLYQIIFEHLDPQGIGALQVAFEQMKKRLSIEGLFDQKHKKPLPFLPRKISIITSPSGAVVHDILKVLKRRFPGLIVRILPVNVQGEAAIDEICTALHTLQTYRDTDVAILARGGGSLEDLQAFNSEKVARAIFALELPLISAIGHQTDYTISDFVADVCAPTPSVAAEIVVPSKSEQKAICERIFAQLDAAMQHHLEQRLVMLKDLKKRLRASIKIYLTGKYAALRVPTAGLKAQNPQLVLQRGYSITRTLLDETLVRDSKNINPGEYLKIKLQKGSLICNVIKRI